MEEDETNGLERVQLLNANLREQQGLLPRDDEQTHHLQQQPEDEPMREALMGPREHEMDETIRNALDQQDVDERFEQLEKRVEKNEERGRQQEESIRKQEESIRQMKLRISELEQQNITLRQKLDEFRELQDHLVNIKIFLWDIHNFHLAKPAVTGGRPI
jgi:hypothetical protein